MIKIDDQKFFLTVRELTGLLAQLPDPDDHNIPPTFTIKLTADDGKVIEFEARKLEITDEGKESCIWTLEGIGVAMTARVL